MHFRFIEGNNFSGAPSDSSAFIVNETMVKQMGLKLPYVGRQMSLHDKKGTIIGLVKDFHFQSLKTKIQPFFGHNEENISFMLKQQQPVHNRLLRLLRKNMINMHRQIRLHTVL